MKIIYLLNKKKTHFPPESVTNKENIKHNNSLEKEKYAYKLKKKKRVHNKIKRRRHALN
jgi:hypothetical protein